MNALNREEFISYRRDAIKAAKDFEYGEETIKKLKAATTILEVQRIMVTRRHEFFKDKWEKDN